MGLDPTQQGKRRVTVSFVDDPSGDSSDDGHELILAKSNDAFADDATDASWSLGSSIEVTDIEAQEITESPLSHFPSENYGDVDIDAITRSARPIPIYLRLPNTAYGISMGLAGHAILWQTAEKTVNVFGGVADTINFTLWFAALLVAILVTVAHIYKFFFKWSMFEAELKDKIRVHFFNGPNLTLLLLGLGVPSVVPIPVQGLRVIFAIGLLYQTVFTQFIYDQWLFGKDSSVSVAKPPFLLSVIGWILLATLGTPAEIEDSWGLNIPQFCLGIALVYYLMVVFSIFNSLHQFRDVFRGSPSLTLLLAPPAVAVVALDDFQQDTGAPEFSQVACAVLGWALILFILLGKIGPKIANKPTVCGEYWAYVFPLAAFANAWLRYAMVMGTKSAEIVGIFFWAFATLAFILVIVRDAYHAYLCASGRANWGDPILLVESSCHPSKRKVVSSRLPKESMEHTLHGNSNLYEGMT